jgi:CRISPR-associated endonuclease/helicase Cas3
MDRRNHKEKYKYPILAKPSGITLDKHRQDVISEGKSLLDQVPFVAHKYEQRVGRPLARRLELVCQYHDDGKEEVDAWQLACQKDYEEFLSWQRQHIGESFVSYAREVGKKAGRNIRGAGVRHEFGSLQKILKEREKAPLSLLAAIAAHHGKLGFVAEERWQKEGLWGLWKMFRKESNCVSEKRSIEQIARKHYEFAAVRGLLQLADHRASARESGDIVPLCSSFQYTFPHPERTGVQRLVEEHWQEDLLLLRAPTGAGKTDASLLWASLQIEHKRADRLVIAMPTRFTSNALAINVADTLSGTGLYHSSAWAADLGGQEHERKIEIHEMARLLQTPVTVCTIDHLLMALTLTREDHHLMAFNLANACLVIDEADFYDEFTLSNILVFLEILKFWDVPVLLMSASLPDSVLPLYQKTGYQTKSIEEDSSDNGRTRFEIKQVVRYSALSEIESFLNLCIERETVIVYVNTVDTAILFYEWFRAKLDKSKRKDIPLILYHSRFTEPDKYCKEKELVSALGKDAWKEGTAKGIAILTQIGEMSVNISSDIMISELCPIDRLSQRTGRLCRFDKTKHGDLFVLIPVKNENIYPAPYGTFDRKSNSWNSCEAYKRTLDIIEKTDEPFYSAEKLVNMINHVYKDVVDFSPMSKDNSEKLRQYFSYNWLINPKCQSDADDSSTDFWKSRNILRHDTVFVRKPPVEVFRNFFEYQNWKIRFSVELPLYLIKKAIKGHKIDTDSIRYGEHEERVFVIREGFYDKEKGAAFREADIYN